MSARMKVLAVMSQAVNGLLASERDGRAYSLHDARILVAELLEASREKLAAEDAHHAAGERMATARRLDNANSRFRAAIDRFGDDP